MNSKIPKITNADQLLKNSYPEGFNDRSKPPNSARKSVKIDESHNKSHHGSVSSRKSKRNVSK